MCTVRRTYTNNTYNVAVFLVVFAAAAKYCKQLLKTYFGQRVELCELKIEKDAKQKIT